MKFIEKKYPKTFLQVAGLTLSILLVAKLVAASGVWSNSLVILETTSWAFILCIVFILYRFYSDYQKECIDLQEKLAVQKTDFASLERTLNLKISELELLVNTHQKFLHHKEESLNTIFSSLNSQNLNKLIDSLLPALAKQLEAVLGIIYWYDEASKQFVPKTTFAIDEDRHLEPFTMGSGFCGQAALDQRILVIDNIPDGYFQASSGLGTCAPSVIYYLPIDINGKTQGLIEIGGFKRMDIEKIWPEVNQRIQKIFNTF